MSKEDKFKKNLQHLMDERHFSFEESDWEAAKKVIDENRRKRRFGAFWFVLSGIALLSTLALVLPSKSQQNLVAENTSVKSTAAITESVDVTNINQSASLRSEKKVNQPNIKHTVITKAPFISPTEPKQQPVTVIKNPVIHTSEVSTSVVSEESNSSSVVQGTEPLNGLLVPLVASSSETVKQENAASLNAHVVSDTFVEVPVSELALVTSPTVLDSSKLASQEMTPITNTPVDPKPSLDSAVVTASSLAAPELPALGKKIVWSAEAGFNVLFGWNSSQGLEGRGFNPLLGLNYHNSITEQLDYSIGFNFTSIAHLYAFSDTSKITSYKFGEESQVTVISPRTFYYINFPFRVNWNLSAQQSIGANFELGYLLNVNSEVTTYQEALTIEEKQSSKEFGYTEGVSPFNFQFGLFYRRQLIKNLFIQPEFFIGLVDLKNDAFFNYQGKERSSGIKLSLLYALKTK